jgi:excisionase family DNA binding protein
MSNQDETYQRISVPDAAKLLGISAATVRRRIRDGSLQAERVHRPQGITYAVLVGSNHSNQDDRSTSNHQEAITARPKQSGTAPADAMMALIQTTISEAITPLVQSLRELERENGVLSERVVGLERDLAVARAPATEVRTEPAVAAPSDSAPAPPRPLWGRLWLVLAVLAVALVLAGVLLTMPR